MHLLTAEEMEIVAGAGTSYTDLNGTEGGFVESSDGDWWEGGAGETISWGGDYNDPSKYGG